MRLFNHPFPRGMALFLSGFVFVTAAMVVPVTAFAVVVTASDGEFSDRVQVKWTKDESANSYYVERCTNENTDSCETIGKQETLSLADVDAEPLVVYYYRVTTFSNILFRTSAPERGFKAGVEADDDFGNSCNEATTTGENSTTAGSLETVGDTDYFRVDVTVPGELIIHTSGGTDMAGALKGSNCSTITSSSSGGADANFRISQQVQPGTYFVETGGDASATGSYQLSTQLIPNDDYGNSCNDARSIDPNTQRSGKLEVAGDVDYLRIELFSSGILTLSSLGNTNTYGTLKDANCSTLAESDGGAEGDNYRIVAELTAGFYFIETRAAIANEIGGYEVRADFEANDDDDHSNTCEEATNLGNNASLAGVIEREQDFDIFRVTITQRGTLQLFTNSDGMDTYGELMLFDCQPWVEDYSNDDGGEDYNFLINADVSPGEYFIKVSGDAYTPTGSYEIVSNFVVPPETGGSCPTARGLRLGWMLDELETNGDQDYFQIDVESTGTLKLESYTDWNVWGPLGMVASLRDASCNQIDIDNENGEDGDFLLVSEVTEGTYYLQVDSYDFYNTGMYEIHTEFTRSIPTDDYGNNCGNAYPVTQESITEGFIGGGNDHDVFRIELDQNSLLVMKTTGDIDTSAVLRNADCDWVRANDDYGDLNFRIGAVLPAGVYYLDLWGYFEETFGSYQLQVSTVDDGNGVDMTLNTGLNDAWFNPETNGQGFFVTVFPETDSIFVSWFTHESFSPDGNVASKIGDAGHRWYTALGKFYGNEAWLDLELTSGGRLNSGDPVDQLDAGYLYVRFDDCSSGVITYDLRDDLGRFGRSGSIPVQRAVPDGEKVCDQLSDLGGANPLQANSALTVAKSLQGAGDGEVQRHESIQEETLTTMNYGLNDAWYNPEWPGQGFFVTVFPDLGGVFVSWFTFDKTAPVAGTPFEIGSPDHRWFTAFGNFEGNEAEMNLELTQHGLFNDPTPVQQSSSGKMTIKFEDCYNGSINYQLDQTGESGEIPIVRALVDPNTIFECENPLVFDSVE